jgi:cytochrome c oxidase subunit III
VGVTLLVLAVVAAIAGWWLWQQGLMTKPWLEEGPIGDLRGAGAGAASPPLPAAKIGLGVFIAVASALLALFVSAYMMRMHMAEDWRPLPEPRLLWLNTGVLVLSSVALHRARVAARRGRVDELRAGLLAGGVFALAFLAGQLLAWRQLTDEGHLVAANPANAFFYLLTAVHGLHLLGGLVALGRTIARARRGVAMDRLRLSVDLCATYWHFLLLVWLVLFALLLLT